MRTSYLHYLVRLVLIVTDLLLVNITFWLVFFLVDHFKHLSDTQYRHYLLVFNMIWIFSANFFRMYSEENIKNSEQIYRTTWRSLLAQVVLFVFYLLFTKDTIFSRQFLLLLFVSLFLAFLLSRFIGTFLEVQFKKRVGVKKPVSILGKNRMGKHLAEYFETPQSEYQFEGYLNEESDLFVDGKGNVLPEITKAIGIAAQSGVSEIYVPLRLEQILEARHLLREAERQCVRLKFIPLFSEISSHMHMKVDYMGKFPVISIRKEPLEDTSNRFRKRAFDLFFSGMVLLLIMSWLYPLIALLIKLEGKGPVLFKQLRSGRDNVPFVCYKFRSMQLNEESDTLQATKQDPRITRIGRFLRRTSLDEFPQFFNVFRGDMSVVGPRPHMLQHTKEYGKIIDSFMIRHFLKPGITGWAQVNGYRGQTSKPIQMRKRVASDIWYLEHWSIMLDVKIIFLTIINVFKGEKNAF